jgi:hypothetical protein
MADAGLHRATDTSLGVFTLQNRDEGPAVLHKVVIKIRFDM